MKAPSASPRWNRHPSVRQVSVLETDEGVGVFGELEDRKESEESSPALLTGIKATEAQRSAARHEKILFNMLYLPLLTDNISNIDKDITLSGISQLSWLSNTQKKRSAAARDRSAQMLCNSPRAMPPLCFPFLGKLFSGRHIRAQPIISYISAL